MTPPGLFPVTPDAQLAVFVLGGGVTAALESLQA